MLRPMKETVSAPREGLREEPFPPTRLDLVVKGIPASLQSGERTKKRWRTLVETAARAAIKEEDELYGPECRGILVYFYFDDTDLDIDNAIKPISDALCGIAYYDDRIVTEWIARKTDLGRTELVDPPVALAARLPDWLAAKQPFVYISVVDQVPNHMELPK